MHDLSKRVTEAACERKRENHTQSESALASGLISTQTIPAWHAGHVRRLPCTLARLCTGLYNAFTHCACRNFSDRNAVASASDSRALTALSSLMAADVAGTPCMPDQGKRKKVHAGVSLSPWGTVEDMVLVFWGFG